MYTSFLQYFYEERREGRDRMRRSRRVVRFSRGRIAAGMLRRHRGCGSTFSEDPSRRKFSIRSRPRPWALSKKKKRALFPNRQGFEKGTR